MYSAVKVHAFSTSPRSLSCFTPCPSQTWHVCGHRKQILHNIIANQNIYLMFYVWTNEISLWAGLLRAMQHKICLVAMCSCLIVVRIIALTWKKLIVYYLIASHLVRTFLGSNSKLFFMLQYWIKYCGNNIFEQTQTWKMYIKSWLHAFEISKQKLLPLHSESSTTRQPQTPVES